MSWQAYVDQQLVGTGCVTSGAIIGLDGSIWAKSPSLNFGNGETQTLAKLHANPADAQAKGIFIASSKYMTLRADNRSIYGKKGAGGVVVVKTNQAVLIGLYNENIQPGQCANAVEKLADYLIENGY